MAEKRKPTDHGFKHIGSLAGHVAMRAAYKMVRRSAAAARVRKRLRVIKGRAT